MSSLSMVRLLVESAAQRCVSEWFFRSHSCRAAFFVYFVLTFSAQLANAAPRSISDECYAATHGPGAIDPAVVEACRESDVAVHVKATRSSQELTHLPASVAVISPTAIERSRGSTPAELVRDVPSVSIVDGGEPGLGRIRLRGEDARRVAILIDGQEFLDQREVGTPVLIAPEQIERIEVVRGPLSVLHGSRAMGGIVNIITKKGGYHPIQGSASVSYDTATDGHHESAAIFGKVHGFEYRVGVAQATHKNRHTPDGTLDNTRYENDSFALAVAKVFAEHRVGLTYDQFNGETEVWVDPRVATTPPLIDFRIDAPQRDREKVAMTWDFAPEENGTIAGAHVDTYFQRGDRKFNTFSTTSLSIPTPSTIQSDIFTTSQLDTVGVNSQITITPHSAHEFITGFQYAHDDLEQERRREVTSNSVARPAELTFEEANQARFGVFLQDDWRFASDLTFNVGGRVDWVSTELDESTRPGALTRSTSDHQPSFTAGLSYTGIEDTTLWIRAGQGFLFPSLLQLGTGAFAGPSFVNPNPDLESETSYTLETGVRIVEEGLTVDGALFFTRADDYIDHVLCSSVTADCIQPAGARDRVYVNIGEARTFGAEATLSYTLGAFEPYLNAAWIRRELHTGMYESFNSGLPPVSGRAGLRIERSLGADVDGWADLFLRFAEDTKEQTSATEVVAHAGWGTANAAFGVDIGPKRRYRIAVEVQNLGDRSYTVATENIPAAGLSAMAKFTVKM